MSSPVDFTDRRSSVCTTSKDDLGFTAPLVPVKPSVPKMIFIIPYRDRENQKNLFKRQMMYVLEDLSKDDYKMYFSEQCDTRDFNRGAMKNIGFLVMKEKYPNDYKNITFIFNDVDTMPYQKNLLNYITFENNIKHFFGYESTLGGIVSVLGSDFEKILGFPNLWSWGYEDNSFKKRAITAGINIDRGQFYNAGCKEIVQFMDEVYKKVNRDDFNRYIENKSDGIHTIQSLDYTIDEENQTIKVNNFLTPYTNNPNTNTVYDVRTEGRRPFIYNKKIGRFGNVGMKMAF
jgi:hypothetical protein